MWLLVVLLAVGVSGDRYHPAAVPGERAVPNLAENDAKFWVQQAQDELQARLNVKIPTGKARNVVMFLGDGMSLPTIAASRILYGQRQGANGEESVLSFEKFPTTGLAKTYCVDNQIADSACTATAYLCGVKNNYGALGVTAAVPRGDCDGSQNVDNHVESIAEWALADGRDVGIVTTSRITHASPGGAYAKTADRDWEADVNVTNDGFHPQSCPDIAHQLVHFHPANKFKVILGGGRRSFLPSDFLDEEGDPGRRLDGRNLIEEWQQDKRDRNLNYQYVWNRKQLMDLNDNLPDYLLGLFESAHMQYHLRADPETEPTLEELTEIAIKMLSRNEKGFFLFVEGARIDHAHHDNLIHLALDETIEMHKALERATELLSDEETLFVVTADHAHAMAFNGYSDRGHDILGASRELDEQNVPYQTLSYTNGPGFRPHVDGIRPDVTKEEDYGSFNWVSHVDAYRDSETHGGEDVAVFARGPHHNLFTGLYEQHQIPHIMAYIACFGPGAHSCNGATLVTQASLALSILTALCVAIFNQ